LRRKNVSPLGRLCPEVWSHRQAVVSGEAERVGTGTAAAALHRTRCSGLRRGRDSFADDTCRGHPQFRSQRNSGSGQAASRYYSEFRTMPSEDRSNCQTGRVSCIPAMSGSASTRHSILPISLGTSLAFRGIGPRHGNSRRPAVRRSSAADIGAGSSVAVVDCCLDSQEFQEIARGKMSKTMPSI